MLFEEFNSLFSAPCLGNNSHVRCGFNDGRNAEAGDWMIVDDEDANPALPFEFPLLVRRNFPPDHWHRKPPCIGRYPSAAGTRVSTEGNTAGFNSLSISTSNVWIIIDSPAAPSQQGIASEIEKLPNASHWPDQ
jgi:hypothetical protein